jgi:cholesterol oxidase
MSRLSSPIAHIKANYDVVVVGSGYGGAVAASRLCRARTSEGNRLSVCVLERGREYLPGDYPDTAAKAFAETQIDTPGRHYRSRAALYDFRVNNEINVFLGCGLGGTSLINANVALWPEAGVFEDPRWPAGLRNDVYDGLLDGYTRATEMLDPTPYPTPPRAPRVLKLEALRDSSVELLRRYGGWRFTRPPLNVEFSGGTNKAGVPHRACTLCGDCVSGCNYGAKSTLATTYLPDAKAHGAEIFTQVSVRHVEARGGRWLVRYELLDTGRERFTSPPMTVTADFVVLAGGTLGSTEVLLRSRRDSNLCLSDQLGQGFSGNGDVLSLAYNSDRPVNAVGTGRRSPMIDDPVGPCITSMIDMRGQTPLEDGMVIQEGSIPGALAGLLPVVLGSAVVLFGSGSDVGVAPSMRAEGRNLLKYFRGSRHGAVRSTQIFLVVAHDGGGGSMHLLDDRLRIAWPGLSHDPTLARIAPRLREAARDLGGTHLRNPFNPITVHPLGGCRMADTAETGVVDHEGRAFSGRVGDAVHDGLYVCDAAIIPRSIGVNPLLTITALAERMCALMARRHGWTIAYP